MKTYQMYYERDFLAVFIPFISLFFMGDIVVLIFCAFFSSEGIASSFCTWMILSLSVLGLVFLTPVLCHVFVIQHRRKVALSGERKLSEVYCTYKWKLGLYLVVFKYRNSKNRTCKAEVNVPYDIYIKMNSDVVLPIYVNGNYAYIKMDEIIELCNGIEDTNEFKYIDERPSKESKKDVEFDEFDADDDFDEDEYDFDEDEDEYDFDDED